MFFHKTRCLHLFSFFGLALISTACVDKDKFPAIGEHITSPSDIAASSDGSHFFVLNADADKTYNVGSILVLNAAGDKITAVETPRLGRSIEVAGNILLASYGGDDEQANALEIYDVSNPALPIFATRFEFPKECVPVNTTARAGYPYFAMTCTHPDFDNSFGQLYLGALDLAQPANSSLHLVRNLYNVRRAMHIDPVRGALIAFPGDPKRENAFDFIGDDSITYTTETTPPEPVSAPNEVPDTFENSVQARERLSARHLYQIFVYDINTAAAENFPFLELNDPKTELEYRWIYYSGTNIDGWPDINDPSFYDPSKKYYRTNFWTVAPDPDDADSFYISHRNRPSRGLHANDVLKVSIIGDLLQKNATKASELAFTDSYLQFQRVYGFNGEVQKWHYPGDIEVHRIQGEKVLFVNHFRDLVKWDDRENVVFGLVAKSLEQGSWFKQVTDTSAFASYYQLAANQEGVIMSCSFYGNSVIRLAVTPGADNIDIKRIE